MANGRTALRGGHFGQAAELLGRAASELRRGGAGEGLDEAVYLRALALYYAGKPAEAARIAGTLPAARKDSPWLHKARFLQAAALVEGRKWSQAEAIYQAEAARLLSAGRKRRIAEVVIGFADRLAAERDANDLSAPPPDYAKAANLYRKVLDMEIGRDIRDDVTYKLARTLQRAGKHSAAVSQFREYLGQFDPNWTGPVGSAGRLAGLKRTRPVSPGKHFWQARYYLATAQLAAGDYRSARLNLEGLLKLLAGSPGESAKKLIADADWQLLRTYRLPNSPAGELDKAVAVARGFCRAHRRDGRAVVAAWWIAQALQAGGRADDAIAAYRDFIEAKGYDVPAGRAGGAVIEGLGKGPRELAGDWRKRALYEIGRIRFAQKDYAAATAAWKRYVNRYPDGPQWSACQRGIIDAEFQVAVQALADGRRDEAAKFFQAFLADHPLDGRVRQILYTLGQMEYARAAELEEHKAPAAEVRAAWHKAIDHWSRLVGKYPKTEESSLALYRIGVLREEKLGDLTGALDAYRRLTWGSWAARARMRVAVMTHKHLALKTERKFRTNEPAKVVLDVRNIKKLTFKQYFLDLEAYFRKTHGTGQVERLDIELIQPEKTWQVDIDHYEPYKPLTQEVEIPFPGDKPGVCVVNVGEDDLEATTLVIRSDLDLIVRSSRREAVVLVEDMRTGRPAAGVKLLLSDGKKVFAVGKTGADGVFRAKFDQLKDAGSLGVFAAKAGSVASNVLNLAGLKFSKPLAGRGYIYTDRPAYQPGQAVRLRGIIRDVRDGSYVAPAGVVYEVSIMDPAGRLLWRGEKKLSQFGTFRAEMPLADRAPLGTYTITARRKDRTGPTCSGSFQVQHFKLEKMHLELATDRRVYFRGEKVKLTILAEYYWHQPVAGKPVRYRLPDGSEFVQPTDKDGKLEVTYDTSGMRPPSPMVFTASIEGENVRSFCRAALAAYGYALAVRPSRKLVLAGEPLDVEVAASDALGKPVAREVTIFVLRRQVPRRDPVLSAVPWIARPAAASAEVTVRELKVTTDAKTGKAVVNLKLEKGGRYILRASGLDRFKQAITAQASLEVSDDTDATRLRFFSETDTLKVGQVVKIRLHSRLKAALALLTFEGETILAHRVIPLRKGYNDIELKVGGEYFPNFAVAVSVMDGRTLRTASKEFTVQRRLNVKVRPLKDVYAPGAAGKVELTVTDQLGRPVRAELSLAMVDEALFAVFPDRTPRILEFFQAGARRHAEFRAASTCGFHYAAVTRAVIRAYQHEAERLSRLVEEDRKIEKLRASLGFAAETKFAPAKPPPAPSAATVTAGMRGRATAQMDLAKKAKPRNGAYAGRAGEETGAAKSYSANGAVVSLGGKGTGRAAAPKLRREMPAAGFWLASIVTDKAGRAVVKVPM
ncbi:MAG: tetratricopeptide repeat protein, partial [Planctomycetes bacterium]|nr:tetratricopeptide repeat protein [Planctomycetota bacterium]